MSRRASELAINGVFAIKNAPQIAGLICGFAKNLFTVSQNLSVAMLCAYKQLTGAADFVFGVTNHFV
jgi:hypothetical protein